MEQEKDLLQGQVTWLNTELKAKSEELLSLSRQSGNEILELQCNLNNKEDEVLYKPFYILFLCILSCLVGCALKYVKVFSLCSNLCMPVQITHLKDQVTSLKASNENLQRQAEEMITKMREVRQCYPSL